MPMVSAPPGRLSTTTGWPRAFAISGASRRAIVVGRAADGLRHHQPDRPVRKVRARLRREDAGEVQKKDSQGCSWARTSPPLFATLWTFTYRRPSLNAFSCSGVSLRPSGTE